MDKHEMELWKKESIEQAYERFEGDIMAQWAGLN